MRDAQYAKDNPTPQIENPYLKKRKTGHPVTPNNKKKASKKTTAEKSKLGQELQRDQEPEDATGVATDPHAKPKKKKSQRTTKQTMAKVEQELQCQQDSDNTSDVVAVPDSENDDTQSDSD